MDNLLNNYQNLGEINYLTTIISFILCILSALVLKHIYTLKSNSLTGKYHIGSIIPLLALTTFLVISVVKSSLALSLGLVGALSIVRFRTAIKDPEELTFLFVSISIGLALGASQNAIAILGFSIFFVLLLVIKKYLSKNENNSNMQLIIESKKLNVDDVVKIVNNFSRKVILKRLDSSEVNHMIFFIDIEYDKLKELDKTLKDKDKQISLVFMNNKIIV